MNTAPSGVGVLTAFGLGQGAGPRNDLRPIRASRRQHPMVADQVESWRRHEGGQFLEQFMWGQQELARPVCPGGFQGEHQGLLIDEPQPAVGNRRSNDVATEPFESASIGGLKAGGGMQ